MKRKTKYNLRRNDNNNYGNEEDLKKWEDQ